MSARSEIERHQLSLDSRTRPHFQKRSTSLSHLRTLTPADLEVSDEPPLIVDTPSFQNTRRQKSVSVCVAALPTISSLPRTIDQYEQLTVRNGIPQQLSAFELHTVRLPALSTSEVFNEPPQIYVYKPRPQVSYGPYMPPKKRDGFCDRIRKSRHSICAFACGFIALSTVLTVIILQMCHVL